VKLGNRVAPVVTDNCRMRKEESVARQVWQEFSPREGEELAFREDSRYGYLITVTTGRSSEEFDIGPDPDRSLSSLVHYLANRMQTIIMEERQQMIPDCPLHPAAHPLESNVVDDMAAWVCPSTKRPVRYMSVTTESS
jgi:hypothetical protein